MSAEGKRTSSSVGTVVFMAAALVFAGLAGMLVTRMLSARYPQEPVMALVVAQRDIKSGRPLVREDLRLAQWPRSSLPKGSFQQIDALLKVGAVPLRPLVAGEALLTTHLAPKRSGIGVAAKLQPGQRAMTIRTDSSVTLAQLIYPGARVDLLTTMRQGSGYRGDTVKTKVLLQNVLVLAVGPDLDPRGAGARREQSGKTLLGGARATRDAKAARRVLTVAVTTAQAERLVLASREGKIDVVLRSPRDQDLVETPGVTPQEILGKPASRAEPSARAPGPQARTPAPTRRRARPSRRPRRAAAAPVPAGPVIHRGGGPDYE